MQKIIDHLSPKEGNEGVKITNGKVIVFNQRGEAMKHQSQGQHGADQNDVETVVKQAGDGNPPPTPGIGEAAETGRRRTGLCNNFDDPFQADKGGSRLAGLYIFRPQ